MFLTSHKNNLEPQKVTLIKICSIKTPKKFNFITKLALLKQNLKTMFFLIFPNVLAFASSFLHFDYVAK